MKSLLILATLLFSLNTYAAPHLARQWSRSTLIKPHYKFRNLNRMAPLLTETLVIQGNGTDGIKAFNRKTGHEQWSMELANGVEGGATVDENRLFFGANDGHFYCVDVNTGTVLWTFKLNSESLTSPLVVGSMVFHVTGNNTLYAFNKQTGESRSVKTNSAKANMTVRGQTAPVHDKGILYLGFSDGVFAAINAQNGRELWTKRIGDDKKFNDIDATAVITSSCILVSSYANSLYCLDKNTGSIRWRHDVGAYQSVLVDQKQIYYPTINGEIHLLDEDSGKLIRKVINIKGLATEVVSMGKYLIYGESNGELVVRTKKDMNKVESFAPGLGLYARPTVDLKTGQVYIVSNDANIYRLDFREKLENPFLWSKKSNEK